MTGMTGYICNDCVEQAHNILREESLLPKSDFEMTELPICDLQVFSQDVFEELA